MLAAFLSLAGMPPFGGFVAKVFVFAAGVQANYTWLVVIGILNSIVGVYYYLNVMKYVYLYRSENEDEDKHPIGVTNSIHARPCCPGCRSHTDRHRICPLVWPFERRGYEFVLISIMIGSSWPAELT